MELFIKRASFRLALLVWLLAIGTGGAVAAGYATPSQDEEGNDATMQTEVMEYDFAANPELIERLATGITDWNTSNKDVTIYVNNYGIHFYNCLRGNGYLSIRGDYEDKDAGPDPGHLSGSMGGVLTQLTLTKRAGNGNITLRVEGYDGQVTELTQNANGIGTVTFDIPLDQRIVNAKSISIKPDFKCNVSKITLTRQSGLPDKDTPWVVFKTLNDNPAKADVFPTDDAATCKVAVGQIVQMTSNGIEGFDPVSAMSNPYVVTYTVDGTEPMFSNQKDGSGKYWKNGNDNDAQGQPIGLNGYVYRRGIVLGTWQKSPNGGAVITNKVGDTFTVRYAIFKVTNNDDGTWSYEKVKEDKKVFTFDDVPTRPLWDTQKDLKFIPDTRQKTDINEWTSSMTVLDPTENVTVAQTNWLSDNTIIAKFSHNDKYDLQSLLNSASISPAKVEKSMKSSGLKMRKLSAMQYTPDGIASNAVAEVFYWFVPARKQLTLEATSKHMTDEGIKLNMAQGSTTSTDIVTLKAYYLNDENEKVYVNMEKLGLKKSDISFSDTYVAAIDGDISFTNDEASFTITAKDNGTALLTIKTQKTNDVQQTNDDVPETAINFAAASTAVNVMVDGSGNLTPPTISPKSGNFDHDFDAQVKGYSGAKTYYMLLNNGGTSTMAEDDTDTPSIPTPDEVVQMVAEYQEQGATAQIPYAGAIDGEGPALVRVNAAINGSYMLCAVVAEVNQDGTLARSSRVVYSQYTYNKLAAPELTPGVQGENNFFPFSGSIEVQANVQAQNAKIYYVKDQDVTFHINDNGTIATNCQMFDASSPILIDRSTVVRAIAYSDSLGIVSDVVTYRYSKKGLDVNEPFFVINNEEYTNGDKYTHSLSGNTVSIKATYFDADGKEHEIGGDQVDWDNDTYHIYYSLDGNYLSANSQPYKGPISIDNTQGNVTITAGVYADGQGGDLSVSDVSVLYVLNSGISYWETTETNCPQGQLANRNVSIKKQDGTGETLVDIQFGGSKSSSGSDLAWKHYVSKEYATGNPIDDIGKYTIAPALDADEAVADVKDEADALWNHSKANNGQDNFQTHRATYGLPASGAYVKFEPKVNGQLTIWCCQEGALFYSNKSTDSESFNEGFLRKRPAYFVDEAGRSYQPTGVNAAGVLSSNWNTAVQPGFWNAKGSEVNGVMQTLYTSEQTEKIYNMFNSVILGRNASLNSPLLPLIVRLNTEANKTVAGFNVAEAPREEGMDESAMPYTPDPVIDGTGICLPSASYMKYTFNVKAGKTYFFFGWMTKIGIRGFGFEPDDTQANMADDLTIYSGKSATTEGGNSDKNDFAQSLNTTYRKVTVDRKFKANTWTTLVLPFSVSATQLQEVFGQGTEVLHYRTIENTKMYFFKHFHQMVVAGTPVLIRPTQLVDGAVFKNVSIESATVADKPCNDYGYNGNSNTDCPMVGSYNIQTYANGNYYITSDGNVKKLNNAAGSAQLPGTRAYIVGTRDDGSATSLTGMARASFDNPIPTDMDGETTDIDGIETDAHGADGKVYNLNGQLVRTTAEGAQKLAKGVYVTHGKKVIIK